jgi:hypothetical protein
MKAQESFDKKFEVCATVKIVVHVNLGLDPDPDSSKAKSLDPAPDSINLQIGNTSCGHNLQLCKQVVKSF